VDYRTVDVSGNGFFITVIHASPLALIILSADLCNLTIKGENIDDNLLDNPKT
jgi:hypothetical protein